LQTKGVLLKSIPPSQPNLFTEAKVADGMISEISDINDLGSVKKSMLLFNLDVLIHYAAQPIVRLSYQ
jgi:CDP-glucose 4,6-dehydratase